VHVFERARGLSGAVLRFGEELLHGDVIASANPVVADLQPPAPQGRGPCRGRSTAAIHINTLAEETQRATDSRSVELQRHLLATLLLRVERWFDSTRIEQRDADDPELQLYRAFVEILERDFTRHHSAAAHPSLRRSPDATTRQD